MNPIDTSHTRFAAAIRTNRPFQRGLLLWWAVFLALLTGSTGWATTYYLDAIKGDDHFSGTELDRPWKTLDRANAARLRAGDRVLLAAGRTFSGQLAFNALAGTAEAPIRFSSYQPSPMTDDARATIDARGYVAAVHLRNSRHVQISELVVTADGGGLRPGQPANAHLRCGILIDADAPGQYGGFELTNLLVRNVSFEEPGFVRPVADVNTANGTLHYGWGIRFRVESETAGLSDLRVTDCQIERVDHTGLKFTAPSNGIQRVTVQRVRVLHSGGPGVQISGMHGGLFSELYVNGSGSTNDTRNWGRGSGLWTWTSSDVVIEHSHFLNANGPADSAGVHIDYNCRNVVVQYNLSASNAGGFCEVLGNNYNNSYRYNVSVNDGWRIKGQNGALQEGKIFWLSGFIGKRPQRGPFNTYFYNNTIYTGSELTAKIAVAPTAEGVLIANNIFCIRGRSQCVAGDQYRADSGSVAGLTNVLFENNLYLRVDNWPREVGIRDRSPRVGDPEFPRPGGSKLEDYIPRNAKLVKSQGIRIPKLPCDAIGLTPGLGVERDILGRRIAGPPSLGAVELP